MTTELLDVPVDAYHADQLGDTPSLNSTVAKALVLETPAHAKQKHPRLMDGDYVQKYSDAMDEGTALHQMLLGDDRCDILDFDAFRTNEAKDARDLSRSLGRVPLLRKKWDEIALLGDSLKEQVSAFPIEPKLFVEGRAEQTIVWNEPNGITCRARLDWLRTDYLCIDDLKKSRSANKRDFHKTIYSLGYHIQAAFYVRACKAAFGVEPLFRWVAIESDPPYAMTVHTLRPNSDAMDYAQHKVTEACEIWQACLESGEWPAYPLVAHEVELPPWLAPVEWDDAALEGVPF